MHHDIQVISTAEHVPLARRETVKVLARWGMSEQVVDTACLIISELVTNVVQHATVLSPTATVSFAVEDRTQLVLPSRMPTRSSQSPYQLPTASGAAACSWSTP
ncbi:ATP-binding protein [Streptomyces sp. NPDC001219]